MLNNHLPVLKDGYILHVSLKNKTQDNELVAEKTRIFAHLRSQLKNAKLNLETEIVHNEQHTKKAFTAAEKAKLMAEKNPILLKLTNKFDLDVE
ncbi:hypothetical protein E9993_12930 [Labilibacter sediminis]|nr:hypothetical protein E9993_12930 [Labilibacter sediminis]